MLPDSQFEVRQMALVLAHMATVLDGLDNRLNALDTKLDRILEHQAHNPGNLHVRQQAITIGGAGVVGGGFMTLVWALLKFIGS